MSAYPQLMPGVMAVTLPHPEAPKFTHGELVEVMSLPWQVTALNKQRRSVTIWVCDIFYPEYGHAAYPCTHLVPEPPPDQRRQFARESDRPVTA